MIIFSTNLRILPLFGITTQRPICFMIFLVIDATKKKNGTLGGAEHPKKNGAILKQ
jgi:hypothetical protein